MRRIILLFFSMFVYAQEDIGVLSKANINSILIFSSQDGLSSGVYHFKEIGISMDIYHLPIKWEFARQEKYRYFAVADLAFSRAYVSEHSLQPRSNKLAYNSSIDTYLGGVGIGGSYFFNDYISATAIFELYYSRAGLRIGEADVGDHIKDFFNSNYNDNLTYKIETDLEYKQRYQEFLLEAACNYRLYETKSNFSFSELGNFHSESNVFSLMASAESPKLLGFEQNYLTLQGYIYEHFLSGTVSTTSKVKHYTSLGLVNYLYTPKLEYIRRFFLELSSARSNTIEGYNVGVGFSVRF